MSPPLSSAHAWTLTSKRAGEGGSYLKRVLRNSYLGLVPPRVICEVGDGGGWPTSQITRGGTYTYYTVYSVCFVACVRLSSHVFFSLLWVLTHLEPSVVLGVSSWGLASYRVCMYYGHSTCMCRSPCAYRCYDQRTCMYYALSTCM